MDRSVLYPHQTEGYDFLTNHVNAVLAFDTGLGKTFTSLAALDKFPALVVGPKSIQDVWINETNKWRADLRIVKFKTSHTPAQREAIIEAQDFDILVCTYGTMLRHTRHAAFGPTTTKNDEGNFGRREGAFNKREWGTLILDEAHALLSPTAQQTRAAWRLREDFEVCWCLTATPLGEDVLGIWNYLRLFNKELFGSRTRFIDNYLDYWTPAWGGIEVKGFNDRGKSTILPLLKNIQMIRKKEDVVDLPPLTRTEHRVSMTDLQAEQIQGAQDGHIKCTNGNDLYCFDQLAAHGRQVQIALGPLELDGWGRIYQRWDLSPKRPVLLDMVKGRNTPTLVVCLHQQVAEDIAADLGCPFINGDTSADDRSEIVEQFQQGEITTLVLTYGVGGVGITLTAAHRMIRVERGYSAIGEIQMIGRAYRIGTEHSVEIIDILTEGTKDEDITPAIESKIEAIKPIMES